MNGRPEPYEADHIPTGRTRSVPTWVMVSAVVAAIVVTALVAIALLGGDTHGPQQH